MTQWHKLLQSLGFTASETEIYLAALELGPSPVMLLAKKTGISRVTVYAAIESLVNDGLLSTTQEGKKKFFVAESPERLVSFVHSRVRSMQTTLQEIETGLPELQLLQRGAQPLVKIFEGQEALRAIFDDVIATKPQTICEIGNLDAIQGVLPLAALQPQKERLSQAGILVQAIYLTAKKFSPRPTTAVRYLPKESFSFNGDVAVYHNKVALTTFQGKLIAVLIESNELAETMRAIFRLAWNCASFLQKKSSGPTAA